MLSPTPYEVAILASLKQLLEQIKTANGYHTDAGGAVFLADERLAPQEGKEVITLIVHDGEEELLKQDGYTRDVNLRIDVEIFVPVPRTTDGRREVREATRKAIVDVRTAGLQILKGDSAQKRPINVTLDGRVILPLENGGNWMVAVQPILWREREEFQSV